MPGRQEKRRFACIHRLSGKTGCTVGKPGPLSNFWGTVAQKAVSAGHDPQSDASARRNRYTRGTDYRLSLLS